MTTPTPKPKPPELPETIDYRFVPSHIDTVWPTLDEAEKDAVAQRYIDEALKPIRERA